MRELLKHWDDADEDIRRAYLIQMRTLSPSDKILRIDADSLLYYTAYAASFKDGESIEGGTFVGANQRVTFKDYKQHFAELVDDIVLACEIASFRKELPRFKDYELVFTPSTNFRYDIFPEYKKSRVDKSQSNTLKRLKKYAKKHLGITSEGIEADDYVYYWAQQGHPVASGDKDVVYSVPAAYYYHSHHQKVVQNTKEESTRFTLMQTLAGDSSDDIPGIKGVGMQNKLLAEGGTFDDVVEIYKNHIICVKCRDTPKGRATTYDKIKDLEFEGDLTGTCPKCKSRRVFYQYTTMDAILTRRLVGLDQWTPRRGVRLWTNV